MNTLLTLLLAATVLMPTMSAKHPSRRTLPHALNETTCRLDSIENQDANGQTTAVDIYSYNSQNLVSIIDEFDLFQEFRILSFRISYQYDDAGYRVKDLYEEYDFELQSMVPWGLDEYTYNNAHRMTKELNYDTYDVDDGWDRITEYTTTYLYDTLPTLLVQREKEGGVWYNVLKQTMTYNNKGQLVKNEAQLPTDDGWTDYMRIVIDYNADDTRNKVSVYVGDNYTIPYEVEYYFYTDGKLTKFLLYDLYSKNFNTDSTIYEYDLYGNQTHVMSYHRDSTDWVLASETNSIYDAQNRIISYQREYLNFEYMIWCGDSKYEKSYNEDGLLEEEIKYSYDLDSIGNVVWYYYQKQVNNYDEDNNLTTVTTYTPNNDGWAVNSIQQYAYTCTPSGLVRPSSTTNTTSKIEINGHIYIINDGILYHLSGSRIK